MTFEIRRLTADDAVPAFELGATAFGYVGRPMPDPPNHVRPGRVGWGAFTAGGSLVAKALDLDFSHWFGGRLVPGSGVAGVAVAPEVRGQGTASALLRHLLTAARDRGAAISTLFDTTPVPYRRSGWEEIGALQTWTLPTSALAGLRAASDHTTRAATEADVPAMLDAYRRVARAGNGVVDRNTPMFDATPAAVIAEHHGASVVLDADGAVQGYCTWNRDGGYGREGRLIVEEMIALTGVAATTMLAMFGTWASVAPNLLITVPADDPFFYLAPVRVESIEIRRPWMLRVIDAAAAVAARGWPEFANGTVDLAIEDTVCPWNDGSFRLTLRNGVGALTPGGDGRVTLGPRGLAAIFAGGGSVDVMRRSGLLTGGDASDDALLQAAMSGPPPTLRDYF